MPWIEKPDFSASHGERGERRDLILITEMAIQIKHNPAIAGSFTLLRGKHGWESERYMNYITLDPSAP